MQEPFEISADHQAGIVRIRVWGFWSGAEAEAYRKEMVRQVDSLLGKPWSALVDVRLYPVQKTQVQTIHRMVMGYSLMNGMVRSANIVGGRLTRIQVERLAESVSPSGERFRYFTTEKEALKWLREVPSEPASKDYGSIAQTL